LMCEMDFISFNFANCRLIREKTLSNGNEYCDFWVIKNEPQQSPEGEGSSLD